MKRVTPAPPCSSMPGRSRRKSASTLSTPTPAAVPMAISLPPILQLWTASALTARARIPITSRCISPRSSRGRDCCIGSFRPCDERADRRPPEARPIERRWRRAADAWLVFRPTQGPQAARPSGRPDRTPAAAACSRYRWPRSTRYRRSLSTEGARGPAGSRLWRWRASGCRSKRPARLWLYRLRTLRQRDGQDPGPDREAWHRQHPPVRRRCRGATGLAATALAVAHRPDPSRSLAETAALETPLCAGCDGCGDGACAEACRRVSLRQRHCRLLRMDALASCALARFCLARRARRRLAAALGRLHPDALRPQSRARRTGRDLFAVSARRLGGAAILAPGRGAPASFLIAPFPIDDIPERPTREIGTQIVAEEIYGAMTVLVTDRRDMRRDQYPGIGPEPLRRRVLEFADINIERCAAQMIALERVGKRLLVDDLTPGNVDEHASRLHRCKAILVEETGGLRCPLAADHHEIALRQEPIEILRSAKLAEPRWQGPVRLRMAAGADDPHAEGGAEFADIEPDSAGAHDARGLAFQEKRSISAMVEHARAPIDRGAVEALGKVQNTGQRIFSHRQRIAQTP